MEKVSCRDIERSAALPVPPYSQPTWIRPIPVPIGEYQLAGGLARFTHIDVITEMGDNYVVSRMDCAQLIKSADDRNKACRVLDNIMAVRPEYGGLDMSRAHIMGVLNTTPDSFSDGGQYLGHAKAIAAGKAMKAAGASLVDVGGESTRPGAAEVTRNQELARILPPITALARVGITVSVDTRHAEVMHRAISAGASIINDVQALQGEGALAAAAKTNASVVMMHMQGTPKTMQENPVYGFAPVDIYRFLEERVDAATAVGIPRAAIAVDPGFGFGKTVRHNLVLLNWLSMMHGLGVVVLFGASRKSSIAKISKEEPVDKRLPGSLTLALAARRQGAHILRVHDVEETAQALAVETALLCDDN
jgi:dihydropteroate synthase